MIKAVIFDIGDVVVRPKYGKLYKRAMKKIDAVLGGLVGEKNALRQAVIKQRRAFRVNGDVMAVIRKLQANGYMTPSITNTPLKAFEEDTEMKGGGPFHGIVSAPDIGLRKSDRRVYEAALRRFRLRPEECVFVDDKEENLAPARVMGMRTVLFKKARQLKDELHRYGVRVG